MNDGVDLLDLTNLPSHWRTILQIVMREQSISHDDLVAAVKRLPDGERLDDAKLKNTIAELTERRWLQKRRRNDQVIYKAFIRRKGGSAQMDQIWNALGLDSLDKDEADAPKAPEATPSTGRREVPENIWNALGTAQEESPRPRRERSKLMNNIWDSIANEEEEKPKGEAPTTPQAKQTRRKPTNIWDNLTASDEETVKAEQQHQTIPAKNTASETETPDKPAEPQETQQAGSALVSLSDDDDLADETQPPQKTDRIEKLIDESTSASLKDDKKRPTRKNLLDSIAFDDDSDDDSG